MDLKLEKAALGLGLALLAEGLSGRHKVRAEADEVGGGAGRVVRLLVVVRELVREHEIACLPGPVPALLAAELLDNALLSHGGLDDGVHGVCGGRWRETGGVIGLHYAHTTAATHKPEGRALRVRQDCTHWQDEGGRRRRPGLAHGGGKGC